MVTDLQSNDVYLSNVAQGVFTLFDDMRLGSIDNAAIELHDFISERMPTLNQSGLIVDMSRANSLLESLLSDQLAPATSMMAMVNTFTGPVFRQIHNTLVFVADRLFCMRYADFGMCRSP